ncbi:hypothetical protein PBOI14_37530 [Pseudomonas sp. Boi14]|nr:hypothetical protein PBOI14_37530 [Pseudomonas sp. Boi14]
MSLKVEQSASQLLHEAFVSLRTLGKRSILALLGIVIGSSSVVALINIGHNAAEDAAAIFQNMGTDTLVARFPASADSRTPLPAALDTRALSQAVPSLVNIAPTVLLSATLIRNGRSANASVVGATAELAPAMRLQLREGRFLSDFDQNEIYAVIGHQVAQTLGAAGPRCNWGTGCGSTTTCSWSSVSCRTSPARCWCQSRPMIRCSCPRAACGGFSLRHRSTTW